MYTKKIFENRVARRRSQRIHDQLKTDKRLQLTLAIAAAVASNPNKKREKNKCMFDSCRCIFHLTLTHTINFLWWWWETSKGLTVNFSHRDSCSRVCFLFEFLIFIFFLNHFRIWKERPVCCVPCTVYLYTDDCTRDSNIY